MSGLTSDDNELSVANFNNDDSDATEQLPNAPSSPDLDSSFLGSSGSNLSFKSGSMQGQDIYMCVLREYILKIKNGEYIKGQGFDKETIRKAVEYYNQASAVTRWNSQHIPIDLQGDGNNAAFAR